MPRRKNIILSGLIFILLITSFSYVKYHRYTQGLSIVVSSDAEGYYQYLTAVFVEHDILAQPYGYPLGDGKTFNKYNYGVALMEMPFFLVAHGISKVFHLPLHGKFTAYVFLLIIGTAFYVFVGLLLLFRLLRRNFNKQASLLTLVVLFLGTNLSYYTCFEPGMSHAYAFFLVAVWIVAVDAFYTRPGWRTGAVMALSLGILALIRIPHVLVVLYLPLYQVSRFSQLTARSRFLMSNWKPLLLLPLAVILFYIPQLLYWHAATGQYIVNPYDYSYADEGFPFVFQPRIAQVLFSPVGGWITINPLIFLALAGIFMGFRKSEISAPGVLLMILIPVYVYASWWHPNIDASYGHRGMLDLLPFLILPMAFVIQRIMKVENRLIRNSVYTIIFLFVFINLRLTYSYSYMWWDVDWGWPQYFDAILKTVFLR